METSNYFQKHLIVIGDPQNMGLDTSFAQFIEVFLNGPNLNKFA